MFNTPFDKRYDVKKMQDVFSWVQLFVGAFFNEKFALYLLAINELKMMLLCFITSYSYFYLTSDL